MKNYYELLGVTENATAAEIKAAYRKLSLKYHPDRNPNNKASEEKFKEVNEAYQTLGDEEKRRAFDAGVPQGDSSFDPRDHINDILKNMGFNINFDFQAQSNPFIRNDINRKFRYQQQINITLHNAVFGCEIGLDVPSYINCKDCHGIGGSKTQCGACSGAGQTFTFLGTMKIPSGCITCDAKGYILTSTCSECNREGFKKKNKHIKLKIPAGVQAGAVMHLSTDTDDRCDIFIVINVVKHPKISRNGVTLFTNETISCLDAIVGASKIIETLDGHCELKIPAGTQHGQQLIIHEHGGLLSKGRGNYVVTIQLEVPKNLTAEQITLIETVKDKMKKN